MYTKSLAAFDCKAKHNAVAYLQIHTGPWPAVLIRFGLKRLLLHSPPSLELPVPIRAACLTNPLLQGHCKAQVAAYGCMVPACSLDNVLYERGLSPPHPMRGGPRRLLGQVGCLPCTNLAGRLGVWCSLAGGWSKSCSVQCMPGMSWCHTMFMEANTRRHELALYNQDY